MLDEVKENDFNLNIPRYVDTFVEEEAIDINLVAEELKTLDNDLLENQKILTQFCNELNIKTPF